MPVIKPAVFSLLLMALIAGLPGVAVGAASQALVSEPSSSAPVSGGERSAGASTAGDPAGIETGICRPFCGPGEGQLTLEAAAVRLPVGRVGKPYKAQIAASGGQPPYLFSLVGGKLPEGLKLGSSGVLEGKPQSAGARRISVAVVDAVGQRALRAYALTVLAPPAASSAVAASAAAPALRITKLTAEQARASLAAPAPVTVYELTQELINSIADPALFIPPGDIVTKLNSDARAQLKQLLAPLVGVEYPNRRLFAAALDARVCSYAADLLRATAAAQKLILSAAQAQEAVCPGSGVASAKGAARSAAPAASAPLTAAVPVAQLTETVLPPEWRNFVISRAQQAQDIKTYNLPGRIGTGCNCLIKSTTGTVYGFFPLWHADARRPKVDWGIYDRVELFAQLFDRDGNLAQFPVKEPSVEAFLRELHTRGSEFDITLHQSDWQFLANTSQASLQRAIRQIAAQAVYQADQPMPGWRAQWQRWLPGDEFGEVERTAAGITLYLAPPDDVALQPAFARFRAALIAQLIEALRASRYPHVFNVVLDDDELTPMSGNGTVATKSAAESMLSLQTADLFSYLVLAEDPTIEGGHIRFQGARYHSNTSLTMRFLMLLPEPVANSARRLRRIVESDPGVMGGNQEILLRKMIPLVSVGSGTQQQFSDNMAYFLDNFGGVALWQPPVDLATSAPIDPAHAALATMQAGATQALRATFLAGEPAVSVSCSWVCDWHWPLRALFFALLLLLLAALTLFALSSRIRAIGLPYQIGLLVACLITVLTGGALLQCDPGLQELRDNNNILYGLLAALMLCALVFLMRPKVEKP